MKHITGIGLVFLPMEPYNDAVWGLHISIPQAMESVIAFILLHYK